MTEGQVIICSPRDGGSNLPGSTEHDCADCGQGIWLAPTGQALAAQEPTILVCIDCGAARIASDPDPLIHPPTSEQVREIRGWFRRN